MIHEIKMSMNVNCFVLIITVSNTTEMKTVISEPVYVDEHRGDILINLFTPE